MIFDLCALVPWCPGALVPLVSLVSLVHLAPQKPQMPRVGLASLAPQARNRRGRRIVLLAEIMGVSCLDVPLGWHDRDRF